MRYITVGLLVCAAGTVLAPLAAGQEGEGIPAWARQEMQYHVGRWEATLLIDGKEIGKVQQTCTWAPDRTCIRMTETGPEKGLSSSSQVGWDPEKKQLVRHEHASNGVFVTLRCQPGREKDATVGTFVYRDPRGMTIEGTVVGRKKGPDEFVSKAAFQQDGKEGTREIIARRLPAPPKPSAEEAARLAKLIAWFEGEWTVTKVGDEATKGTLSIKPTPGGRYHLCSYQFGDQASHSLFGYDPLTRRWTGTGIGSDGNHSKYVWDPLAMERLKPGDTWKSSEVTVAPDGTRATSRSTITIVDNKTFTIRTTGGRRGTEKLPDVEFRYTRKE